MATAPTPVSSRMMLASLVEGLGHQEQDEHLQHLGDHRGAESDGRTEQILGAVLAHQVKMQKAADQPLHGRQHGTGRGSKAAHEVAVHASGQSNPETDHRAAENAAEHRANGPGVGNGPFDLKSEVGTHDAETGEHQIAHQFVGQAHGDLHQGSKERGFAEQVGDGEIDAHLLHQAADQGDVVDVF